MTAPAAAGDPAAFVAKWRAAWPEWSLVEVFLPPSQRAVADAWQALQFEWQEAAWRNEDARPGEAKLRWWMDELDGWSRGMRRHPLGAVLQRSGAAWRDVARALPTLDAVRARPRDADAAWSELLPLGEALAEADAALFNGPSDALALTACWLHARTARHPGHAIPVQLAGSDTPLAVATWSRDLLARWPATSASTAPGAIALALAKARLERGSASAPLPPWAALWAGWRAARR